MRILHVIHSIDPTGGGPIEGVRQLAAAQSLLGCHSEVLSLDPPNTPHADDLAFPHYGVGPGRGTYAWSPRLVPWLKSHRQQYDIVVVNGLWQFHGLAVRTALHGSGIPYCVFPHGMLDPWFKERYPLKHLKKMLYWPWAEYRVLRDADAVLFTTEEERVLARESFAPYRCNEIVVHHGTAGPQGDPEGQRALFQERFPETAGKRLLLFLGRVHEKKGCDLLIDAFSRSLARMTETPFHLVMAGPSDNEFGRHLRKLAHRLGIADRITWTGMLSGDLKWGAFHAAEVFGLPSHQENFGIAVAEALACALPVLISKKVNIWREIEEDRAGMVDTDNVHGATRLLEGWARLSDRECETARHRARECFLSRFEINKAAVKLRDVLETVVARRKGKGVTEYLLPMPQEKSE